MYKNNPNKIPSKILNEEVPFKEARIITEVKPLDLMKLQRELKRIREK